MDNTLLIRTLADEQELRYCDVSPLLRIAERQAQLERLLTPGSLT